jgi:hypothetical protein
MDPEIVKLALVVALLTAGLAVVLLLLLKKGRQRAENLGVAFELGTSRPAGVLGSAVDGLYRGYSCRYQIQYASQYDRGGASLQVTASSPHQWSAEVAKPGTGMLTKIGLLKDLETGDRELDEHFRFASSDDGSLRSLFGAEAVRDAMHVLAASENFESIRVRPDRIDVKWSPRTPKLDEDAEALRARLEFVTSLVVACGYPPGTRPPSDQ